MGDGACQSADHLHFLRLPHFFFEMFALRNVSKNALNDSFPFELRQARIDFDGDRAALQSDSLVISFRRPPPPFKVSLNTCR